MGWVVTYIDDVESDLSAFHRVDRWREMPSRRFVRLAERLPYYHGIIRARAEEQAERTTPTAARRPGRDGSTPRETPIEFTPIGAKVVRKVEATAEPYDIAAHVAAVERRSRGD